MWTWEIEETRELAHINAKDKERIMKKKRSNRVVIVTVIKCDHKNGMLETLRWWA